MEMMRILRGIMLAALTLGAICLPHAEAAYKPKISSNIGGQSIKEVQKVVSALKAMPKPVRWAFLAEKLGLLFMPSNGASGHDSKTGNMLDGSHFIGVDGVAHDAKAEYNARPSAEAWNYCDASLERLGQEVVFSKLSGEVTALVLESVKYHMEKMAEEQPERRDMYLAYLARLCYFPGGKNPYDKLITYTAPHKQPIQFYNLDGGCLFIDTKGSEYKFGDIHKKYTFLGHSRWTILFVCAHHVGARDILALYPEEVKKLRANYKKKMQELSVGAGEAKEETTSEPGAKAESLVKKLGVTYRPKINADRMNDQIKKDVQGAVSYLKSLPKSQRWCFITERLGLMFMPQNGEFGHKDGGEFKAGSHFIGANGLEYDSKSEMDACPSIDEWRSNAALIDQLGRELVFSQLPTEVAELVLQNAKYHLGKLAKEHPEGRDAILARLAHLEYLPDGKAPYVLKPWKWGRTNVVNEFRMDAPWERYYFTDSEGREHRTDDACRRIKGRWPILLICAHHVGKDAILALCPKEVKKLRTNYEKWMTEFMK